MMGDREEELKAEATFLSRKGQQDLDLRLLLGL